MFSKISFFFFKPKPNLRVNALNLKGIEWLLCLVDKFIKNLKEIQKTLMSCSLMEVDIDKNVEFKISSKVKEKEESGKTNECESKKDLSKDKDFEDKKDLQSESEEDGEDEILQASSDSERVNNPENI